MKKLPQQYLCQRCGYVTNRRVAKCPACQDGEVAKWTKQEVAEWVVSTCLMFGSGVGTAHKVAGTFVAGLDEASHDSNSASQEDGS